MSELKETLKQIFADGVDGVMFFPTEEETEISVKGFTYNQKSKYIISDLGNHFHIILYKFDEEGNISSPDNFDAILTDPYVYISNIIDCGFYGIVTKKTKRSKKFVNDLYKQLKSTICNVTLKYA